jgi:solute carrier family 27 fatty acid transporter 1/4
MENRPEFVATWLGLSKLGVITALINTNLKQQALVHSITIAKSKVIIYGVELGECECQ